MATEEFVTYDSFKSYFMPLDEEKIQELLKDEFPEVKAEDVPKDKDEALKFLYPAYLDNALELGQINEEEYKVFISDLNDLERVKPKAKASKDQGVEVQKKNSQPKSSNEELFKNTGNPFNKNTSAHLAFSVIKAGGTIENMTDSLEKKLDKAGIKSSNVKGRVKRVIGAIHQLDIGLKVARDGKTRKYTLK